MLFGRLRILGKLAVLVLVPLLGVVALSVPIVANRMHAARSAQDTADAVALATEVGTALQKLQEERLLSVGFLFGLVPQPELAVQSAEAKDSIAALDRLDQPLPTDLKTAIAAAAGLDGTRTGILARTIRPDLIVSDFTTAITRIIDALALARQADLTTTAGRQILALEQALRSDDMISQAAGYLTLAVASGQSAVVGLFSKTLVEVQLIVIRGQPFFTALQYQLYLQAQAAFVARAGPSFFTLAATDPAAAIDTLDITTLLPSLRSVVVLGGFLEKRIAADVTAEVTRNRRDATGQAYLVGGLSLMLLVIVFALSTLMARAVARPLRRLTGSADRIARAADSELRRVADDDIEAAGPVRLEPVDVQAKDEIGDLARAFDRVQTTAARLVERQVVSRRNVAQMFGHVGRRTQNLVSRQLALIDQLERRETDSDRLRELYRLDHMSSRLRRNASSLVVLSGVPGTIDYMAPMRLSDVCRLALGEIEDYPRVDVDVPEDLIVLPAIVADLTLVLAELMENATSFSPPHTRVSVLAAALPSGARLAVIDHGLGLTPERLAEENSRLTRRERLDLAPSEVLGLFVVGRLARRHGFEVALTDTRDGGVTAWVDLRPMHLLGRAEPAVAHPIPATVPTARPASTSVTAGAAVPTVPGTAQPFDTQVPSPVDTQVLSPFDTRVLSRATRTLQAGRPWFAFAPLRPGQAAIEAGPSTHDTPVRQQDPSPPTADAAVAARDLVEAFESGVSRAQWDAIEADLATPPNTAPAVPPETALAVPPPEPAVAVPPPEPAVAVPPPETAVAVPPERDRQPLARRVPGATLPVTAPKIPTPRAAPAKPLDPDEARDLIEQFEHGVALALNELRPQPEGQPR